MKPSLSSFAVDNPVGNHPLHAIEAIEQEIAPDRWIRTAHFDGYVLPEWASLPEAWRAALVAVNAGELLAWRLWAIIRLGFATAVGSAP